MSRYIVVVLILIFLLTGCSEKKQENTPQSNALENSVINEGSVDQGQQSSTAPMPPKTESSLPVNKLQPVQKQGENLVLPSGFPIDIVPIIEGSNITSTYEDGETYSIIYQTNKSFRQVSSMYKDLMKGSKIIMEDAQNDTYYTVNGTRENNNIYINVMSFTPDITTVSITTSTFDLTAVEEGKKVREQLSNVVNERDFTPIIVPDPAIYAPPPKKLPVENKSIKMVADSMIINVYVNEKSSDFNKVPKDVIFKQPIDPNNATGTYKSGDTVPLIYDVVDASNIESELLIKGVVEFREKKYYLAEQICTIELPYANYEDDEHSYPPNSDEIKIQVYIPHAGDEYWFVAWNSREIYSINMPKYLIQAEGLENMVEDIFSTEKQ